MNERTRHPLTFFEISSKPNSIGKVDLDKNKLGRMRVVRFIRSGGAAMSLKVTRIRIECTQTLIVIGPRIMLHLLAQRTGGRGRGPHRWTNSVTRC